MNKPCTPRTPMDVMESIRAHLFKRKIFTLLPLKTLLSTLLLWMLLPSYNTILGQAYCSMICNDEISVSIGVTCEVTILYDMILEDGDDSRTCSPNGKWGFQVFVFDENDVELPTSPTIPFEYVGRTIKAKAKHWATGNICWTTVKLVDKIFPRLTCPDNVTINCTDPNDPNLTGYPHASDCSELSYSYSDTYTDLNCGNPVSQIERKWTVADAADNKNFCTQIISVAQPSVNEVVFPSNRDGIAQPPLACETVANNPDALLPISTGMPTIHGQVIANDGPCRMIPSYEDQIVESCEGTYKVLRHWTVVNWCTSDVVTDIQILKVIDENGPSISVAGNITASTNSTTCDAR